jgi:S-DNA-T family DNA segregation ATPase FtsK/SpoIIIE
MATAKRGNSTRKTSARSASSSNRRTTPKNKNYREEDFDYTLKSELIVLAMVALTVFLFLCNFRICGEMGNVLSSILFGLFGITAYIAPLVALAAVMVGIANFGNSASTRKIVSGLVLVLIVGIVADLLSGRPQSLTSYDIKTIYTEASINRNGGGFFAGSIAYLLYKYLSIVGTVLLLMLVGIAAVVVFTQHSFVGGLRRGGRRLIDKTREEADNYRDYAARRKEKMEQRRAELEEERRLAIEQKEDEKILRMEKKVSGVMLDTELDREDDHRDDVEEISTSKDVPAASSGNANLFIPDEDEFHDDIHEITLKTEPDEAPITEDRYEPEYREPVRNSYPREFNREDDYQDHVKEPVREIPEVRYEETYEDVYEEPEQDIIEEIPQEIPEAPKPTRLVARAGDLPVSFDEPLPDVPVHAEHIGNGKNGDYVIHAQDHISMSKNADTSINGATASVINMPGPRTTSPGMEREIERKKNAAPKKYVFPPLSLLSPGEKNKNPDTARQLRETGAKLQETLKTFGVNVTVTDISQGPAVTRFELQPEAGVRVNKIVGLADDIKMNLAASDIRIEAPIPGKAAVGIEVPNKENSAVALRDLFESSEYQNFSSRLAFAVGKDIAGKVVVTDIAKMPHLLIAGATGSGKSVCINTIIMSLIYKADPKDVQLIMIDPKIVELSVYNGIPHLMIPVVTDPKKAAAALNWAVAEMTDRYKKFADNSVRDLKGYNKIAAESGDPDMKVLPQLVVIVDELADLMMVSANEVEDAICRLTQLARAAGIHLIIATQRPSVDVITGLIKANMPSRIAFAVSSGVDSRTILDITGAEKLLGKGDMLFYPQGYTKPARVQGAFVSDKEVQAVTDFLRNQNIESSYGEDIEQKIQSIQSGSGAGGASSGSDGSDGRDEYFVQAGNIIIEKEKASIGMLQRVFKIGFNRAARIMDQLCEAGVVGDEEGTKPRRVLMTKAEFEAYVNNDAV